MRITRKQLARIIQEEKARLAEAPDIPDVMGAMGGGKFQPRKEQTPSVSAARQAEAVEQIEAILNELFDDGVDNAGLIKLLEGIIRDIGRGYVGQPT